MIYNAMVNVRKDLSGDREIAVKYSRALAWLIKDCLRMCESGPGRKFSKIMKSIGKNFPAVLLIRRDTRPAEFRQVPGVYVELATLGRDFPNEPEIAVAHSCALADLIAYYARQEGPGVRYCVQANDIIQARELYSVMMGIKRNFPNDPRIARAYFEATIDLIDYYLEAGDIGQARKLCNALTGIERKIPNDPSVGQKHLEALCGLIDRYLEGGYVDEAQKIYADAAKIGKAFPRELHIARRCTSLAAVLADASERPQQFYDDSTKNFPDISDTAAECSENAACLPEDGIETDDILETVRLMAHHLRMGDRKQVRKLIGKGKRRAVEYAEAVLRLVEYYAENPAIDWYFDQALEFHDVFAVIRKNFPTDPYIALQEAWTLNLLMAWCSCIGTDEYVKRMPLFHKAVVALAKQFQGQDMAQAKADADIIFKVDATVIYRAGANVLYYSGT